MDKHHIYHIFLSLWTTKGDRNIMYDLGEEPNYLIHK